MRYKQHKAKWKDCTKCELHKQRTKVVLARGKLPCDILFVGEAPGQSEDIIGRPFCGPAGKLLDRMISDAFNAPGGIPVRCAFTNLVACIPKGEHGQKLVEPDHKCVKACRLRLREFIKLSKAEVVVSVGRLATIELKGPHITHPAHLLRMDASRRGLEIQRTIIEIRDIFSEYVIPF